MNFDYSDEQKQLKEEARRFLTKECPSAKVRDLLAPGAAGWDPALWAAVAQHGWLGAAIPEEFGGLGLPVAGHVWTEKSWGYRNMPSKEALTRNYVELWRKVWQLKDDPGLSAAVYTQWTDVEAECNGLWTYDRKVLKVDAAKAAAAHRGP